VSEPCALRLRDVTKRFGAVTALSGVSFAVDAGEIHGLVGENGAGKSTLMGIAAGTIAADDGTVEIGGRLLGQVSARAAEERGLAIVYQNPALVGDLSVEENLVLAMPASVCPPAAERGAWARRQLARVGVELDLAARVAELAPGQRQLLEIAKALALEPRVLILDEPTESLGAKEVERLFELVRELAARGTALVYISHRVAEVRRIADRITAMRDGQITGSAQAGELDDRDIVQMIVGRSLSAMFPPKAQPLPGSAPTLVVEGLSGSGFADVSLVVRRGEIVGLAGVEGNGQRAFLRALAGLGDGVRGRVELLGERVDVRTPQRAARSGVRFIPADRFAEGMFPALSVRENIASGSLRKFARAGLVRRPLERAAVGAQLAATAVKVPADDRGVLTLSGGNQQKVVFAKAMLASPEAILCDEPTHGVDVGARMEIYRLLRGLSDAGHPVVVLSADAAELAGLCDTVAVFSRGQVVETLTGVDVTEGAITGAALLATRTPDPPAPHDDERPTPQAPARRALSRRLARSDSLPSAALLAVALVLAIVTNGRQATFLGELNVSLLLYGVAALALIAIGQQIVVLTGGLDLSVGPLAGLLIVVMSYAIAEGKSAGALALGLALTFGVAVAVGALNGALVALARIPAIIATLAAYVGIQGVSLLLRSQVGGSIDTGFIDAVQTAVGPVPVAFLVAGAAAVLAEIASRRLRLGFAVRAVGPGRTAAERMGIRVRLTVTLAYVLCAAFTFLGALLLAAQIGTGDATQGVSYTLSSISAVVLGGASIYGGRGSFVSAFCGALLLGLIANATTFLGLGQAWQYWLPGGVILLAAALSGRLRAATARAVTA
jgi:ribose transport system ATP-binding protein